MHVGYTAPPSSRVSPSRRGSEGRNEATAQGAVYTIIDAAIISGWTYEVPRRRPGLRQCRAIAAQLMFAQGSKIIAVSDSTGAIHRPEGFDPNSVLSGSRKHHSVVGFPALGDKQRRAARARL